MAYVAVAPLRPQLQCRSNQRLAAVPCKMLGRRAVAAQAASFAAALVLSQQDASALSDLNMGEMDIGSSKPAASSVGDIDMGEPIKIGVVTLDANGKKPKKDTPASRLKELQAKGNLTDKEKKELRQLKADEMCEMLGRGC